MESWQIILIIIALIAGGLFASVGFDFNFFPSQPKINLNASLSSTSIKVGEELTVNVSASSQKPISNIAFRVLDKVEIFECNNTNCSAQFSETFSKPGAYSLTVNAVINEKNFEQRKLSVYVFDDPKCLDSTYFSQCSSNKPFYCSEGTLIENCSLCSCPTDSTCLENNKCSKLLSFNINVISVKANDFNIVKVNKPFNTTIELLNTSSEKISNNTKFNIKLVFSNASNSFNNFFVFVLQNDLPSNSYLSIPIEYADNSSSRFFIPETGEYKIAVFIYDENNRLVSEFSSPNPLNVIDDSIPPSPPTGLNAIASGKKAILSWNPNPEQDVAGYNIYQSATITTFFVASNKTASVPYPNNSFSSPDLNSGTHFFVITAFDFVGNESAFSSQASVLVPE